jgi:hypothetical protein
VRLLRPRAALGLVAALCLPTTAVFAEPANTAVQTAFAAENEVAMARMMDAMMVKPSGDIDRDFAAMMIPHHQGAIDMALAELRHGRDERLRRIAQEIIVEQMQEIAAMRMAVGEGPPPSQAVPTNPALVAATTEAAPHHDHRIKSVK